MPASAKLTRPLARKVRKMQDNDPDAIWSGIIALVCSIILIIAILWIAFT